MSLISDEAITLRRTDYSETSQILVLLTREHGKQRLIAKGSRRSTKTRFATGIDLLERGGVVYSVRPESGAELGTLVEWTQRESYAGLRANLTRLYGAQYLAEVTPALVEDADPHAGLFDALADALAGLSGEKEPLREIVRYQAALLTEVGLFPDLTQCTSCGRPEAAGSAHFSSGSGGLVCRDCEPAMVEKRSVSAAVIACVQGLAADAMCTTADARGVIGAFDLLNYHIAYTLGRSPKLADYLVPAAQRRRT